MSEPTRNSELAEILWKMATTVAREQYEHRVSALEEDVAAIREHLAVRVEPAGEGMSATYYYICDACGNIVTIESAPIADDSGWECADCGSPAMWEFTNKGNAMAHAAHIQRLAASGLVRRVKS